MIEITDIRKLIHLVLTSSQLKNVKPLSILIVADAGSGKTELITSFKGKNIIEITDLSYMGLIKIMENNANISHIIIPDFLKITNKKSSTSDNLISFLNNFLEDGVTGIKLYNFDKDFKGRRGGIVTATTRASFNQNKKNWMNTGFSSRIIIASFSYSQKTTDKIQEFIASNSTYNLPKVTIPSKKVKIEDDITINKKLVKLCKNNFRKQKHLQTLLKCNALLRGSKKVEEQDYDEIVKLNKFINLDYTPI